MSKRRVLAPLLASHGFGALLLGAGCGARTGELFEPPQGADGIPEDAAAPIDGSAPSRFVAADATVADAIEADATDATGTFVGDAPSDRPPSSCDTAFAPQTADLFGQTGYFNGGGALPSGHYRVQYVDGCMKYSSTQDWAVQAYADGSDAFWLVGASSTDRVLILPGTVGILVGSGGFATFDECVMANLPLPPMEFDFAGGQLGVWLSDSLYTDNVAGVNGRNPTWSLTLVGDCSAVQ